MARNGWVTSHGDPKIRMNPDLLRNDTTMRRAADAIGEQAADAGPGEPATGQRQ